MGAVTKTANAQIAQRSNDAAGPYSRIESNQSLSSEDLIGSARRRKARSCAGRRCPSRCRNAGCGQAHGREASCGQARGRQALAGQVRCHQVRREAGLLPLGRKVSCVEGLGQARCVEAGRKVVVGEGHLQGQ